MQLLSFLSLFIATISTLTWAAGLERPARGGAESRRINFNAGPSRIELSVLQQFAKDLINFEDTGVGIGELSPRSVEFKEKVLGSVNKNLAKFTGYNQKEWYTLWVAGGATGEFSAVPLNIARREGIVVYLVTGLWSAQAAEEAKKILTPSRVVVIDLRVQGPDYYGLRRPSDWIKEFKKINPKSIIYVYYCDNETSDGIETPEPEYFQRLLEPQLAGTKAFFAVDATSNFLTRPLPKLRTGIVFASTQHTLGIAGSAVVFIRKEVVKHGLKATNTCPTILDYKLIAKTNSLVNTPPILVIHMSNLVLKDLMSKYSSLEEINIVTTKKSGILYRAIDNSQDFECPVAKEFRSRVTVLFKPTSKDAEKKFAAAAKAEGLGEFETVTNGTIRIGINNVITIEDCVKLAATIKAINN